jgi:osmotically inducible protein OsmC
VTFGPKPEGGMKISTSALTVVATVPGLSSEQFAVIATETKSGCPVSAALDGNVDITLDARLG